MFLITYSNSNTFHVESLVRFKNMDILFVNFRFTDLKLYYIPYYMIITKNE